MKFQLAALALATAASAWKHDNGTVYTTEVVTALTTFCPEATTLTHGGKTYTITEATTLTITDCPCTVSKPVYPTSVVVCETCSGAAPTGPGYNATTPASTYCPPTSTPTGYSTGGAYPTTAAPSSPVTAGAAKLSGAGLAAVLGVAALL